ncbi:MAG: flagellar biosynthesis anti-sigma factor FlgM [Clostridium sp.]
MNIKGMGNIRAIDAYSNNVKNKTVTNDKKVQGDRIELSDTAKALSDYSINQNEYDKSYKIEDIKNRIANGTYNVDAKLTAASMLKFKK